MKQIEPGRLSIILLVLMLLSGSVGHATLTHLNKLSLQQSQYLGDAVTRSQSDAYSDLMFQSQADIDSKYWLGRWDFFGGQSLDSSNQTYIAVPELYVGYRSSAISTLHLGRKKTNWSRFDEEWHMGIWQPQVRWDYIHPTSQGLLGLFWTVQNREWLVEILASPMFLPDQGPQFYVQEGHIRSTNRWFWEPQINARISHTETPIEYQVMRPPESEIVFRPGFASRIFLGNEEEGPWVQMAYAYKPLNQLHLGIDAKWRASDIQARIQPSVVNHHVVNLEGGLKSVDQEAWVSFTGDFPDESHLPADWFESSLSKTLFAGLHGAQHVNWIKGSPSLLKLSYLHRWDQLGGSGEGMDAEVESSLDRFSYERVVSSEWLQTLWNKTSSKGSLSLKWIYSIPDKGTLLSSALVVSPSRESQFFLAFDVLSSESTSVDGPGGFISRFRSNDRVSAGYTYVF